MSWRLEVTDRAERDLMALPIRDAEAVRRALDQPLLDPRTIDFRKLAGRQGQWRLRVGRWRVILELDNAAGLMRVLRVVPRAEAYRD